MKRKEQEEGRRKGRYRVGVRREDGMKSTTHNTATSPKTPLPHPLPRGKRIWTKVGKLLRGGWKGASGYLLLAVATGSGTGII